jgi:hypothetical protein
VTFPVESVPDGAVFGPHHTYVGVAVLLFAVFVVADDYARREPLVATAGALLALFAFATVWPYYHGTGAALALAGCTLALAAVCWPGGMWTGYPLRWRLLAAGGVLVALDDVAEHAFGIWTPLDAGFNEVAHLLP